MGIIITVILAISAAVSIGAQGALPGQPLYPIKTEVNEKVEHWFAFSAESEAELSARLAQRRLAEAQELAAEGKLDADTKVFLENEFSSNAANSSAIAQAQLAQSVRSGGNILDISLAADADADAKADTGTYNKTVSTVAGDLYLTYENGKIILTGSLKRANPCVEWQTDVTATGSDVSFKINQHQAAEVCIQVVGEPQEIKIETPAPPDANISVMLESKVVFSGKIN